MTNRNKLLFLALCLFVAKGCKTSTEKHEKEEQPAFRAFNHIHTVVQKPQDVEKLRIKAENVAWINEHVDKNFLLGKIRRKGNPLFAKVSEEYTKRDIYLLYPVYQAYQKVHEAALADGIRLTITSGHRLFSDQIYEWELRWDNPQTDIVFKNNIQEARYVMRYRSMLGTSRHHWGTDIDLNSFKLSYFETEEGKAVYDWLKKNAMTYGFYQPYTPKDEKRPVGYQEEKWHWSYKPLAKLMLAKYIELVSINDIVGFKGDDAAKKLPVISEWVCGINPQMMEED